MAAYRRVDEVTVTCRLTACTPGSAPGPTLGVEYGKPLPFYLLDANDLHPADVTATLPPHHFLRHLSPVWFSLSGASLPRLSLKRGH